MAAQIPVSGCDEQLFLCPGHGHIEDPQLLPHALQIHLPAQDIFLKGRGLHLPFQIQVVRGDPQFIVNQNLSPGVLPVKFLSGPG